MSNLALSFIRTILIGLGATLTFDLWILFLEHAQLEENPRKQV